MRRTLPPVVLVIALLSSTGAWQGPPGLADRIHRIENGLLPPVLIKGRSDAMNLVDRMKYYRVPGVSVAVVNNGRIEWARGYGVIEAGGTQPVTAETLFEAGSISKPVAAMAVLRLVEQGKLDLDEDVNLKLVSWKVPENEFTKEKKVTLRGLLSHSAGMTVHGFPGYAADAEVPTLVKVLDGAKPANTAAIRVDTIPGTKWRYSGGGYTVMQQLLVDVTRKTFPELTRELVLVPMGMKHSTYEQPLPKTLAPSAATAHRNGEKVQGLYHTYPEMAAAGLWTTPSDLALWLIEVQRAVAAQSTKIISTRMANQMVTRQFGDSGLGPALEAQGASTRFGHGGVDEGFEASMIAYVHFGQGAVVMTNGNRGVQLAQEVVRSIAKEYAWLDYIPKEREAARVDPKIYEAYVGQYEMDGMTLTITFENGRLFGQPAGRSKDELYPESETKFFLGAPGSPRISFIKDEKGEVVEMVLAQGGGERRAKRIRTDK